jgi:hypothetical protein
VSFTQVFGGNTIYPSDISYLALALTANTELQWPLETATGNDVVARIIDVTPTGAYSVTMPDAMLTGVGQVTQFLNVGPDTITIKDNAGGTLLSITAGLTFTLYLTDNATVAGVWESFQAGAATAQAQASGLAGYGLVAQGSLLSQSQDVTVFNADFTLGAGNRASAFVWEGGIGTLTLPTASSVGNNWFVSVRNGGEGNLTIAGQGSDNINGGATLVLRPEDSAMVLTDGVNFFTVGYGQQAVFAFDYTAINLAGETGDYTLTGSELNRIAYSFVGEIIGDVAVILPPTTQQYWVANNTTGGSYTLTIATAAQVAPVDVPRASRGIYYCEGSDVIKADTASIALPIAINDGGTGATTAGGALINLGGTTVGINVFTAVAAANARAAIGGAASGANSDITSLSGLTTPLSVPQGGTGLAVGTSGGVPFFSSTTAITSSAALAINRLVLGGGAGAAPATLGSLGTTTTVLHGNASGAPTFGAVSLTADVSGTLPVANGGTGITSFGTGIATFLGTPSSANLAAAVTDETGTGALVFANTPTLVTPILGTPTSGNLSSCTADGTNAVGFREIPQNAQTGSYTLVLADSGKSIFHAAAAAVATYTIPANGSVAYPLGTAVTFINMSTNAVTIAITTDTLYLAGTGTTGSRTLARYGVATATKMTSTTWIISGSGLT